MYLDGQARKQFQCLNPPVLWEDTAEVLIEKIIEAEIEIEEVEVDLMEEETAGIIEITDIEIIEMGILEINVYIYYNLRCK